MKFQLSGHAEKRVRQRNIKLEWIAYALEKPDNIENDTDDSTLLHALKAIPESGFKKLRVIYNETKAPWLVITAFFE